MNPRLGGVAFHKVGKKNDDEEDNDYGDDDNDDDDDEDDVRGGGEGRGYFPQDWPINSDDDDNDYEDNDGNDYESGGGGVGDASSPQDWHTHRSHLTDKPYGHLPGRSSIGNIRRSTFQLVTLATNLSC